MSDVTHNTTDFLYRRSVCVCLTRRSLDLYDAYTRLSGNSQVRGVQKDHRSYSVLSRCICGHPSMKARLETGLVPKKWSESRIAGSLSITSMGKKWDWTKWSKTRGGPLIEVVQNRGYTLHMVRRQTTITAPLKNKQLLLFVFAQQGRQYWYSVYTVVSYYNFKMGYLFFSCMQDSRNGTYLQLNLCNEIRGLICIESLSRCSNIVLMLF